LLFPNGGENLAAGSRQGILWHSGDDVTEALVEYSVNNGLDWGWRLTRPMSAIQGRTSGLFPM
jgi:hypothetical protein